MGGGGGGWGEDGCMGGKTILRIESIVKDLGIIFFFHRNLIWVLSRKSDLGKFGYKLGTKFRELAATKK